MLPRLSQNLTLQEAFETAAQINKKLKRTKFDCALCKKFKLLIDRFLHFIAKHKIGRENEPSKEKNRGHWTFKIVKSRQSYSNGHLPYHCSFYYLACARCMTWRVNLCVQKECAETIISTSILKS